MKRTPARRSDLFLLELIIAILFFSLASAVCVQMFVKAHTISSETQELNLALEKISGCSERFLAGSSFESDTFWYDSNWKTCAKEEAFYVIRVEISEADENGLEHGRFSAYRISDTDKKADDSTGNTSAANTNSVSADDNSDLHTDSGTNAGSPAAASSLDRYDDSNTGNGSDSDTVSETLIYAAETDRCAALTKGGM